MLPLKDLYFRDIVYVSSDQLSSGRCRRVEWPTSSLSLCELLSKPIDLSKQSFPKAVTDFILSEMQLCNTQMGCPADMAVFDEMYTPTPDWRALIRNLYWRARRQSTIWDVYLMLAKEGFVSASALTLPINFWSPSASAGHVWTILAYFSFVGSDKISIANDKIPLQTTSWESDLTW
ncbi:hypothetical protein N7495_001277 [Penicillium taxi]|uniref:uncharacterized protein n=1 Tax=Penicillium taxi TaxID=168475 RepID=UPI002544DD71|nr:uncharacterized protein N7495_001277 [Penicillium taxi]KAJ5908595.1 hypothetical protein N7495_001277 [Penicillium taxi]